MSTKERPDTNMEKQVSMNMVQRAKVEKAKKPVLGFP